MIARENDGSLTSPLDDLREDEGQFRSAVDLIGRKITGHDGSVRGRVHDFLFRTDSWTIRYLVARKGSWFSRDKVLINPFVLDDPELGDLFPKVPTILTEETMEKSPPPEIARPISQQTATERAQREEEDRLIDIRSVREMRKYTILDGDEQQSGAFADFIIGMHDRKVYYLVIDLLEGWLKRKRIILSVGEITDISSGSKTIKLGQLSREAMWDAPAFSLKARINRDSNGKLYDFYGFPAPFESNH